MMNKKMEHLTEEVNQLLSETIPNSKLNTNLEESMRYSLEAGGKRIRPVLLLLTLEMLTDQYKKGFSSALALEMIHTYSCFQKIILFKKEKKGSDQKKKNGTPQA